MRQSDFVPGEIYWCSGRGDIGIEARMRRIIQKEVLAVRQLKGGEVVVEYAGEEYIVPLRTLDVISP